MLQTRVIPCLLLKNRGLVKTEKFKNPKYIGDPINAVKIFNEKEVDEIVFLDITASKENRQIEFNLIKDIASECFMPFAYGGGIKDLESIRKLFFLGAEKVILNTIAIENPKLIEDAAKIFGSQSIVVSVDIKKNFLGKYKVYSHVNNKLLNCNYFDHIKSMESCGAGEIILTSVDQEGTLKGYDIDLVRNIVENLSIPVVANGGAADLEDIKNLIAKTNVSAASAGSLFVYKGIHRAVLINYPTAQIKEINT